MEIRIERDVYLGTKKIIEVHVIRALYNIHGKCVL